MSKRILLFLISGSFFLLFILFSYLVHENLFTQFDFDTTVRLQNTIGRNWDNEFSLLSDLGKFEVSTIIVGGIIVFLFLRKKLLAAVTAGVLYVGFHVIELFGKFFVDHPPPPQFMLRTEQILNFPQFHVRSEYSYPSGHSGRSVFIATILLVLLWKNKKIPLIVKYGLSALIVVYVIAMLISRPTMGEHWSTDVIGGAILGFAFALATVGWLVGKGGIKDVKLFPKYKIEIKKVEE